MFRINVIHIIEDHFKSLRLQGEEKMYSGDIFIFLILPLIATLLLVYFDIDLKPQVGNLIKAMAIFGAFLFNLLAVIHGQLSKIKDEADKIDDKNLKENKIKFAREIHSNITFNILLFTSVVKVSFKKKKDC